MEKMEQFVFRVISNDPDYDNMDNVIEMVESIIGDLSYDRMEYVVDFLIGLGMIPSGKTEVIGKVTIGETSINLDIEELID
jgi:hypothetical protein